VEQAIKKVQCLGSGFRITQMGGETMVISVPTELNTDHAAILSLAKSNGQDSGGGFFVTIKMAMAKLKWHRQRIITCLVLGGGGGVMMMRGIHCHKDIRALGLH